MTIFNWVQKKLHQNVIKDGATKNEKKKRSEGTSEIEKNTKAILDQVALVDALDNWFDGVLTIGTFGFDTLNFTEEYENDDDDECGTVDLDYVVIDGSIIKNVDQELDPLISIENKLYDHHEDVEVLDIDHLDSIETAEISPVVAVAVEDKIEQEKKRTTLAELFMEDKEDDKGHGKKSKNPNLDDHDEVKYYKQNGSKLSRKFSLVKKKLVMSKLKDEEKESRPIKKMHQMIKRMLKKKIHPDIDATKAFKKDVPNKATQKCEALESRYLLNIQDCMA